VIGMRRLHSALKRNLANECIIIEIDVSNPNSIGGTVHLPPKPLPPIPDEAEL